MARIWKGGCIIRARFLDTILRAYQGKQQLDNLLLADAVRETVDGAQLAWRRIVGLAASRGIPLPATTASLSYFDSYRIANLPQNLTQAQRDAFGAHTYRRKDEPAGAPIHTEWLAR
jgi:6-phosphogluconate dehydrogenase